MHRQAPPVAFVVRLSILCIAFLSVVFVALLFIVFVSGTGFADADGDNATIADATLHLEAGPGQAIYGETNLQVGTEVTVRITVFLGETPFEHTQRATVTRDGEFHTVVDLSLIPARTPVTVTVEKDGRVLASERTTIWACQDACDLQGPATPDIETDSDGATFEAGPGRVVRGEAALPPGTTLEVELTSTDPDAVSTPVRESVTVTDDGTFVAVLDLSTLDVAGETAATVEFQDRDESESLAAIDVTVTECVTACESPTDVPETPRFAGHLTAEEPRDVEYGETVLIPVDLHGVDATRVEITGMRTDLSATAQIADGTGDGRVTIAFNMRPESGPMLFAAEPADTVVIERASGVLTADDRLRLSVHAGLTDDRTADWAEIQLSEPGAVDEEPPLDANKRGASNDVPESGDSDPSNGLVYVLLGLASLCATVGIALLTGLVELDAT